MYFNIKRTLVLLCFAFAAIAQAQTYPGNVSSNLKLWLKADVGTSTTTNNTTISTWSDQSGNGINATEATNRPLFKDNATDNLNFNPVISFDGVNDILSTISDPLLNSDDFSAYFVSNSNTALTRGRDGFGSGWSFRGMNSIVIMSPSTLNKFPTGAGAASTNSPTVHTLTFDQGVSLQSYRNGLSGTAENAPGSSLRPSTKFINIGIDNNAFRLCKISEIIIFKTVSSTTDRQKIESYLAIKYGITLNQTSPVNYLASDGGTIWDATANVSYKTDITGIGRDDNSALDQKKSKSVNSNAILTIANGDIASPTAFGANDSWLVWGSDNGATAFNASINNVNGGTSNRMGRIWKVAETGTVGTVEITFSNSLADNIVNLIVHSSDPSFPADGSRSVYEMWDDADNGVYRVKVNLTDGDFLTFSDGAVGASASVLINEIVATPIQDWSVGGFYNTNPGESSSTNDEWIELYIAEDGLNLTSWVIEFDDGNRVTGSLLAGGTFDISNYFSLSGGTISSTKAGDYLVLGNPTGSEVINATGTSHFILFDGNNKVIDQVTTSTTEGTGFNANSTDTSDESISRIPNGEDTNVSSVDFSKTRATLGKTNSPTGTVVINEVVATPRTDWSSTGFNGTDGGATISEVDDWVELYIGSDGINLTGWTLYFGVGAFSGDLTSTGAFDVVNYISSNGGSFIDTKAGDYLILGNPDGSENIAALDSIVLKDPAGNAIDIVKLGGGSGQAPTGASTTIFDEAIARISNGTDTDNNSVDFKATKATLGTANELFMAVVKINEIVTDPKKDWSGGGFVASLVGTTAPSSTDEWIELYIGTYGLNLSAWSLEIINEGVDTLRGNLSSTGAFDVVQYSSGSSSSTVAGSYLVLGNPDGSYEIKDNSRFILKDQNGTTIDQVKLGGGAGEAPSGAAAGASDEAVARIPNGTDTGADDADFAKVAASLGAANTIASTPQSGNGLDFDGVDDHVISTGFTNVTAYTIEGWFKLNSTGNQNIIVGTVATPATSWTHQLRVASGRYSHFTYDGSLNTIAANDLAVTGQWDHVAITAVNSGSISMYINGILQTTTEPINNLGSFTKFYLGSSSNSVDLGTLGYFNGQMDEIRIWSDARTQEEILENMFTTLTGAESNLVAYYNFDQGSGTTLPDLTAGDHDGVLTNMDNSDWVSAAWNSYTQNTAILQSGGSDISTGTSGELTFTDVAFLNDNNDFLLVGHENSDFIEVTSELPSGTLVTARYGRNWHLTKNDVVGTANGNVQFSFDLSATPNADYTYYLLERAGTSGDFSIVPMVESNPSGNSVVFTVNASQLDNGSYYTIGRSDAGVGNALDFDGVNDYVATSITRESLTAFTMEAWFRFDGLIGDGYTPIFASNSTNFFLGKSTGTSDIGIEDNGFVANVAVGTNAWDGNWHHIAMTGASGTNQIYLDGTLVGSSSAFSGGTGTIWIGREPEGAGYYFNGIIDETRIWSDIRTQAEIIDNMYSNLAGTEANLVAYYRMNNGIGNGNTSLPDLSGNGNGGTLTNFDNLNSATASSNYVTAGRSTFADLAYIVNNTTDVLTNTSGELTITSTTADFLQDTGDQIIWGNDDGEFTETTADVPTGTLVTNRITKTWRVSKNDVSSNNGNLTFAFDLGTAPNADYTYYLLTRTGTSGNFSVVKTIGSRHNGNSIAFTIDGAQLTSDNYFTLGRSNIGAGNSLDFDGTDDKVMVNDDATLDLIAPITLEAWIYRSATPTWGMVIDKRKSDNTGANYGLGLNIGVPSFYFYSGAAFVVHASGITIPLSEWHHIAAVYDGSTVKIYIDGNLKSSVLESRSLVATNESLTLGNIPQGNEAFAGKIDEVRIWSKARTKDEIQQNMYRTLDVANESNLVAYYKFDQGIAEGTNTGVNLLTDHSGNNNSGTLTNFALASTASNWVGSTATVVNAASAPALASPGNALAFDGTDDYVLVSDNNSMETSSLITVEAWVNPDIVTGYGCYLCRYYSGGDASNVFAFYHNAGTLVWTINESDNNLVQSTSTISANEWTHIAGVADGSEVRLYVNGILVNSTPYDGTITNNSTRDLLIGKFRIEDGFGSYSGRIDEVRIWNTARTTAEIQANMFEELNGDETGLVAYYKFDEAVGTTILPDESTNSNTGTLTNMDAATDWVSAAAREPFKTLSAGNWNSASTWKSGAVPNAGTAVLSINHDITLDANLSAKMLNIADGITVTLASGQTLSVAGNIINNGSIVGDGILSFTAGTPMLGGTMSNITIAGASPTLMSNTTVTGTLTMTTGNITLGDYDLTISSGGTLSGGSSGSYFITKNTNTAGGSLIREVSNGAGQIVFPIGSNGSYTPFAMLNLGSNSSFGVRVFDGTYSGGTYGDAHTISTKEINKTWDVNALGSGFNTTITIQWNLVDKDAGFDKDNMFISKNGSRGFWEVIASNIAATGGDPYQASASGVTSFSQIGGGSGDSPLPVTLTYFSGKKMADYNALLWQTVTEQYNDYFEIQRADAELAFEAIGKVQGAGDSQEAIDYQFRDMNPAIGINYYRLLQVDYDGMETYSEVIMLENTPKLSKWNIFPNPFTDQVTLRFDEALSGPLQISLYDLNGKLINASNHESLSQQFTLFFNLLRPGIYFLKVNYNNQTHTERITKE